jgi:hypothetical protein
MISQPYLAIPSGEISLESASNTPLQQSSSPSSSPSFTIPRKPVPQVPNAPEQPTAKPTPTKTKSHVVTIGHGIVQFWHQWKWEIIASFFVLAMPLIIVATILPHSGQPLPQWRFRISINALLSIYNVVFKAFVTFILATCIGQLQWTWFLSDRPLYDVVRYTNAANGPWGSMHLLWSQNMRQPLTTFGTLVLIATIAIDPFIQQLIAPSDCSMLIPDQNATLLRSNVLTGNLMSAPIPLNTLIAAINDPRDSISGYCSTGNCTFSEYSTVACCSSCEDHWANILFEVKCYPARSETPKLNATAVNFKDCPSGSWPVITSSLDYNSNFKNSTSPRSNWINMTFDPIGGLDVRYDITAKAAVWAGDI